MQYQVKLTQDHYIESGTVTYAATVTVEANSEEEALKKARAEGNENLDDEEGGWLDWREDDHDIESGDRRGGVGVKIVHAQKETV